LQERADEPGGALDPDHPPGSAPPSTAPADERLEVAWYAADECILVDGEYLVRGLPARILRKLLVGHREHGCADFTNRRLRLDKSLDLPR